MTQRSACSSTCSVGRYLGVCTYVRNLNVREDWKNLALVCDHTNAKLSVYLALAQPRCPHRRSLSSSSSPFIIYTYGKSDFHFFKIHSSYRLSLVVHHQPQKHGGNSSTKECHAGRRIRRTGCWCDCVPIPMLFLVLVSLWYSLAPFLPSVSLFFRNNPSCALLLRLLLRHDDPY